RPSQFVTFLAAVKLLGNKLIVPAHEGIWSHQRGQGFETFSAHGKSESCETAAFGIGKSDAFTPKLGVKGAVLFQKIGDDLLLVAIEPSGDHGDEDLQNHGGSWGCKRRRIHSTEYTANPQEFNGVAPTDLFNITGCCQTALSVVVSGQRQRGTGNANANATGSERCPTWVLLRCALTKPPGRTLLPDRSKLCSSHWSNQWLTS